MNPQPNVKWVIDSGRLIGWSKLLPTFKWVMDSGSVIGWLNRSPIVKWVMDSGRFSIDWLKL